MADPAKFNCTLSAEQQNARRVYVKNRIIPLVHKATRSHCDLSVEFKESEGLRALIKEYMVLEQQCCGFLNFSLSDTDRPLTLLIQGTPDSVPIIEMFHRVLRGEGK